MQLNQDVVMANQILFREGVLDGFGHVSARDPANPDRFIISRSLAPAQVGLEDVVTLDLQGDEIGGGGSRLYLERFIHAAIYQARSDVHGIVHSHSPAVLPFTISKAQRFAAVTHMAGFVGRCAPVYDAAASEGCDCDMLVRNLKMGQDLAASLGRQALVLMRGHGITVVGRDVRQAVFRAVYAEQNAKVQTTAITMGEYTALTEGEAAMADETNSGQVNRAWNLWVERTRQRP